jgi:hypothetical protein
MMQRVLPYLEVAVCFLVLLALWLAFIWWVLNH